MSTVPGPVHTVPEEQYTEEIVGECNTVKTSGASRLRRRNMRMWTRRSVATRGLSFPRSSATPSTRRKIKSLQGELFPLSTTWSAPPQVSEHRLCRLCPTLLPNVNRYYLSSLRRYCWQLHRDTPNSKLRSRRIISGGETGY